MKTAVKIAETKTEKPLQHFSLLNSYNVLKLNDPTELLSNSVSAISTDNKIKGTKNVGTGTYEGSYSETTTESEISRKFAEHAGVSGRYGFYSGSVSETFKTSYEQTQLSFNSLFSAKIDFGNVAVVPGTDVLPLLSSTIASSLQQIRSLNDAKTFVDNYGTHLITKVNLGGLLLVGIQANTTTTSEKNSIQGTVSAAYSNGAESISATISAMHSVSQENSSYNLSQKVHAIGGNPASIIIGGNQGSTSSVSAWAQSVSDKPDSVCAVADSIAYYDIPSLIASFPIATLKLKQYIQYTLLMNSIEKPSIFRNTAAISGDEGKVMVNAPNSYKIISGGAKVYIKGQGYDQAWATENYLTGSYPEANGNNITGWVAESHDCMVGTGTNSRIAAYAIAILDPFDLLDITIKSETKQPDSAGSVSLTVSASGNNLVGGGVRSYNTNSSGFRKYITGNIPVQTNLNDPSVGSWSGTIQDYSNAAPNTKLEVFAISMSYDTSVLSVNGHWAEKSTSGEFLNIDFNAGANILAGGAAISKIISGTYISLYLQSYPKSGDTWASYAKDLDSHYVDAVSICRVLYVNSGFINMDS